MASERFTPGEWRIATMPGLPEELRAKANAAGMELPPPDYWRENDGSFIVMAGPSGDEEDARRIGSANLQIHAKRGEARKADDPEALANAHLLAAAPDLYAALKPLAFSDPANPPPGVAAEDWSKAVLDARAALRKARGEA